MRPSPLLLLKALFAAGSLWLLLQLVPGREILAALAGASLGWFVAGVALQFASRAMATVHMQLITDSQGLALRRRVLFRILLAVQFYSLFLPGTLAGGGVTWLQYLERGAGKGAAAAAVVQNRGLGMLVLVPLGALAILADPVIGTPPPPVTAGLLVAALACIAVFWSPWRPQLVARIARMGRVGHRVADFLERLLRFQRMPATKRLAVMASMVAFHLGGAAAIWCFALAVGAAVHYGSVIWMHAALQAVLLLPLSIAGIGIRDASLIGLGMLVGVAAPTAMAWSLAILGGLLLVTAAGGLVESGAWARRLRGGDPSIATPDGKDFPR